MLKISGKFTSSTDHTRFTIAKWSWGDRQRELATIKEATLLFILPSGNHAKWFADPSPSSRYLKQPDQHGDACTLLCTRCVHVDKLLVEEDQQALKIIIDVPFHVL